MLTDSAAALEVTTINADTEGDDQENLNDEYIVFENTGDEAIDLSGWTVRDEAAHSYEFPQGFTLNAGASVTPRMGGGMDTETELYWGSGSPIWNDDGDERHRREQIETDLTGAHWLATEAAPSNQFRFTG